MVSTSADPSHSRSLSLRGPSSVISHRSTNSSSRHRRQGRSHAGGSTYAPQNEFPVFSNTGDVEIIVSAGGKSNRYLLHRLILTQCSGFFEASTSVEWSRTGPGTAAAASDVAGGELARIGEEEGSDVGSRTGTENNSLYPVKKRWRYELDPGSGNDDIPMLVQKDVSPMSLFGLNDSSASNIRNSKPAPPASNASFFRSVAHLPLTHSSSIASQTPSHHLSQADSDLLRDYDNLFRIFYNYPPSLDSINIADAYIECKTLLTLADMYDALPVVGPRIDHHLLQFQSRLFKQIAKYPPSYLRLGYLARSKVIFAEALIHVVGQWPTSERHIRNTLPGKVVDVILDKVEEMRELVMSTESRLWRLSMLSGNLERVVPAPGGGWVDWLVLALWREWLATNLVAPLPSGVGKPASSSSGSSSSGSGSSSSTSNRNTTDGPPPPYTTATATAPAPPPRLRSRDRERNRSRPGPSPSVPSSQPQPLTPMQHATLLGRSYHLIASPSPSAYLGHDECKRFLKMAGDGIYSRDNLRRFERRLEVLKGAAREVVRGVVWSGLQLQRDGNSNVVGGGQGVGVGGMGGAIGGVGYLTCVQVGRGDWVWEDEEEDG